MIGKFIVYESIFRNRFSFREVVGETDRSWVVRNCRTLDESKIKKNCSYSCAFLSSKDEAQSVAAKLSYKLSTAYDEYLDKKQSIFSELSLLSDGSNV